MNLINRIFQKEITRQVRHALAVYENDATLGIGAHNSTGNRRDRSSGERSEVLDMALEAWRTNPLARRIVELTSQYIVGGGITFSCPHPAAARFLDGFWQHPLNRMSIRCTEFAEELVRTGNLFVLISTDPGGMSYLRGVPSADVMEITPSRNDIEQALSYRVGWSGLEEHIYPAYDARQDAPGKDGSFPPVMLHYAINRPVGAQWGESDLTPLLKWLSRYANWLEDRARLNRYRTAFLYVVRGRFLSEADRLARQAYLNSHPPQPGSILVCDDGESWETINPRLEADQAHEDGLALKKMVAAGAGIPLHFLAEPEAATRTTAEAAGGPTYRHFEQRQEHFLWMLSDLLRTVLERRRQVDRKLPAGLSVELSGADISSRDNAALAAALKDAFPSLANLRSRGLIDDAEFLRLSYKFAGETVDLDAMLARGKAANPPKAR